MHIVIYNISWMGFNVFLALVAVLFAWLLKRTTWKFLQMTYGFMWLLFLPNTLYLLTDIIHFSETLDEAKGIYRIIFIFQYLVLLLLGVVTYFAAVYPVEKSFIKSTKWMKLIFVLIINLLVGFGITLGRVERVNSWDIMLDIPSVIHIGTHMLTSTNSLLLILLFTIVGTIIYLSLRAFTIEIKNV